MESSARHRVAILVPCFKRPEYTEKCIRALIVAQEYKGVDFYLVDDGSDDGTFEILNTWDRDYVYVKKNFENVGLRNTIIDFLEICLFQKYDFIGKMDNDCCVPTNWLNDVLDVFNRCPEIGVLSPNVHPSNAAFAYGKKVDGLVYMPAEIVGGLWIMRGEFIKGIDFQKYVTDGLTGAISILRQIKTETEPKIGWLPNVIVEDIGHWSGVHPEHIKSREHEAYSKSVGRDIAWSSSET